MHRGNATRAWCTGSLAALAVLALTVASAGIAGASTEARNGKLVYTALLNGLQLYSLEPDTARASRLSKSPAIELQPAMSPDGSRIAFVSQRDGNWEIYVANSDGTGARRITNDPAPDSDPAWSPDSSRIVFVSDFELMHVVNADGSGLTRLTTTPRADLGVWSPDGTRIAFTTARGIHVMNADGTGVTRIAAIDADESLSWSPDGARIAFSSDRDGDSDIYLVSSDGTGLTKLTSDNNYDDLHPAWSPDGTRIAFSSDRAAGREAIFVMNRDGSGVMRLTSNVGGAPLWSRDGARIAFEFNPNVGDSEIFIVGASGTGLRQLTRNAHNDFQPHWSPDGRILFTSDRLARVVVEVANPDGSGRRTIVSTPAHDDTGRSTNSDMRARWSPDGRRLVVASARDGDEELYVVRATGSRRLTRLTRNRVDDISPAWSPDGRRIAFIRRGGEGDAARVMLMNADGSNVGELRRGRFCCLDWSPNGRQIAFSRAGDIAIMQSRGGPIRIVARAGFTSNPSWAPDSRRIVFTSDGFLETSLFAASSDGAHRERLTRVPFTSVHPDWSPDGRLIAFSADAFLSLGHGSLFLMNADGANVRRVSLPFPAAAPDWQPRH